MIETKIIASGSDGNTTIIKDKVTKKCLVMDCGVCPPPLLKFEDVLGVLITHCHSDHVHNLRDYKTKPIYGTAGELDCARVKKALGDDADIHYVTSLSTYTIGPFTVIPYHAEHDTKEPVHYRVSTSDDSVWYGCDACMYGDLEYASASTCNKILVDCNYDEDMMSNNSWKVTPYPNVLKSRIVNEGHASNQYIHERFKDVKDKLVLCHLSGNYNDVEHVQEVFGKRCKIATDLPRKV